MTNPNNALGTPNAYSGLTSEEAFVSNADNLMSVGVVKGFTVAPNNPLGMSVLVGGVSGTPDRANVKNANGEVFTIQNRSHAPIQVNIAPASQTQPRLDVIVAYRNFGGTSDSAKQDNPKLVGIIAVAGTPSATPVIPTDAQIRAAITADGGIGSSAGYFIVPRSISVPAGATTLSSSNLSVIAVDNATIPVAAVNTQHAFGTNAADINFQTGSTVGVAVASLTLATSSLVQINASCKVALSSNQETNIIIWDATTGTVLHSTGNASNINDMIRSESASIQVQLAAGKHDIQIQQTAFNGGAGTHKITAKSATITAFAIG